MEGNTQKIIFSGFGGQGIMLIGQLLAYAAMKDGKEVTWMPSYGPEMRGGTANCAVIISDKKIASPLVTQANVLVAMNGPSLEKFQGALLPGGHLFINTSLVHADVSRKDIKKHYVGCRVLAETLENPKVANMVMLGAVASVTGAVPVERLSDGLESIFGGHKAGLIPLNRSALRIWQEQQNVC